MAGCRGCRIAVGLPGESNKLTLGRRPFLLRRLAGGTLKRGLIIVETKTVQIRAARALLGWSAEDLTSRSLLSVATIRRAELSEGTTSLTAANDTSLRRTLEAAGIEFIDENGGGPGVRLLKRLHRRK